MYILCVTEHVHRFMQEAEMRKLELKQTTAALRQLTPDQRKSAWHVQNVNAYHSQLKA